MSLLRDLTHSTDHQCPSLIAPASGYRIKLPAHRPSPYSLVLSQVGLSPPRTVGSPICHCCNEADRNRQWVCNLLPPVLSTIPVGRLTHWWSTRRIPCWVFFTHTRIALRIHRRRLILHSSYWWSVWPSAGGIELYLNFHFWQPTDISPRAMAS